LKLAVGSSEFCESPVSNPRAPAGRRQILWLTAILTPAFLAPIWYYFIYPRLPGSSGTFTGLLLFLTLGTCAYTDARWRRIPNWVTYPGMLWGLSINVLATVIAAYDNPPAEGSFLGAVGIAWSLLGGIACFTLVWVPYRFALWAGGDVKLATFIGLLLGPRLGLLAIVFGIVFAAAVLISWRILRYGPWRVFKSWTRWLGSIMFPVWVVPPSAADWQLYNGPVFLGPFFFLGTLVVLLNPANVLAP
jgi:prepilin peptidase CpaA